MKLNKYFDWIRSQPCHFMDIIVDLPNYPRQCSVHWNMDKGIWQNEVSHIMRKGSTRRNDHEGNVFPNCRIHHHFFEMLSPEIRSNYLNIGQLYLELYREKTSSVA